MSVPIQFFITKVHSLCNLNCTYCYEYNQGNTGWKNKPKKMSLETFRQLCFRIKEHHACGEPFISFHGGEPLMRTPEFFESAMSIARDILPNVEFGMQTNGVLLSDEFITVFRKYGLHAGISLDGPQLIHDRYRVDHQGRGTFSRVQKGIRLMQENRDVWGGILSVINLNADPRALLDFFAEMNPPGIDLLEPDGNWEKTPSGKLSKSSTEYGEWFVAAFDYWLENHPELQVRRFEEILEHSFGGAGSVEYFGVEAANLITIATDGAYESVDQIKSAFDGAEELGLDVYNNTLDEVLAAPAIQARMIGVEALSDTCRNCSHVLTCGGGYYPHRFSPETQFKNPTIYCADYKILFQHVNRSVRNRIGAS